MLEEPPEEPDPPDFTVLLAGLLAGAAAGALVVLVLAGAAAAGASPLAAGASGLALSLDVELYRSEYQPPPLRWNALALMSFSSASLPQLVQVFSGDSVMR